MLGLIFTTIILTTCCSALFMPPDASYFKLKSLKTGKCMYYSESDDSDDGVFAVYDCGQAGQYFDQFWRLMSFTNTGYHIKNRKFNKCIVSNGNDGRFRLQWCENYDDERFHFIESKHKPNHFQIKSIHSNQCIFNNDAKFSHFDCNDNDDQLWTFIMEDSEVKHVAFDINKKKLTELTPFVAGEQVCDNTKGSKEPQTLTMHASKTITETSSFSHSVGVGMSASATFSSGVPMIASADLTVEISANYEYTWGKERSQERIIGTEVSITCAPGEKLEQKCVAHQGALTVPYTMTLMTKETKKEYYISGNWTGTPGYGIQCDIIAIE